MDTFFNLYTILVICVSESLYQFKDTKINAIVS